MENNGTIRASYPDPFTRRVSWDVDNLATGAQMMLKYNSRYLNVLRFVLNSRFAYYRLEVTVRNTIMVLTLDKETLVRYEGRI